MEKSTENFIILEVDVASYYPAIILNLGLFPKHMGVAFLQVYKTLVDRRLEAKRSKNKIIADSLKIVINGSFGKLGSNYSTLYSPDLLIQVTLTGQLALIMLIDELESKNIHIISANTDGIVIKCPVDKVELMRNTIKEWESKTKFVTEETEYTALYSRDINNYIAVKTNGKTKGKGEYTNPWNDKDMAIFRFHKNPMRTICIEAVEKMLTEGIPVEQTIRDCQDLTKFICVRDVKGGAHKNGVYLGKTVRWYYSTEETGTINYVLTGNNVPETEGAKYAMDLPDSIPDDLNYRAYVEKCNNMLFDIGYYQKASDSQLF